MEKFEKACVESSKLNSTLGFHIGVFQGITNTSIGSMILIILYAGGRKVVQGEMTAGDLMTYLVATQNAQKSLG